MKGFLVAHNVAPKYQCYDHCIAYPPRRPNMLGYYYPISSRGLRKGGQYTVHGTTPNAHRTILVLRFTPVFRFLLYFTQYQVVRILFQRVRL